MKKQDEGYALVLVLIVMIVMCLVSASVTTLAMRNLRSQQASIQRMQDKYAAQGEMEKLVEHVVQGKTFQTNDTRIRLSDDEMSLFVTLTETKGTATVTCVLSINSTQKIVIGVEDEKNCYKLTNMTWEYASYEVTYSTGGGDAG